MGCLLLQEVLQNIEISLPDYDAVCMATALHTIASMRGSHISHEGLKDKPVILMLMKAVSKSLLHYRQASESFKCDDCSSYLPAGMRLFEANLR